MKKNTSRQGYSYPDINLNKIFATQQQIIEISKRPVKLIQPIMSYDGKPFLFPNSIISIQGQTGCHKSRIAEHIVSSFLNKSMEINIIGLYPLTRNEVTIVYVDTERSIKDQLPKALQRIKRVAGYSIEEDIPNLYIISLLDHTRSKRLANLKKILEDIRSKSMSRIIVVIDVITDCIVNFNNPEQSMMMIDLMNKMINEYETTFICLIHENPSMFESKARGHLGTEISNKATTILKIGFAANSKTLIEVRMLKSRLTKKYSPIFLRLNSATEMLELADSVEVQSLKQTKANYDEIIPFLIEELSEKEIEAKTLIPKIAFKYGCSRETATARMISLSATNSFNRYGYELIYEDVPGKKKNKKQFRLEKLTPMDGQST